MLDGKWAKALMGGREGGERERMFYIGTGTVLRARVKSLKTVIVTWL